MKFGKHLTAFLCVLVVELGYVASSRVTLTSNAYSNLVVAISPDIPKTDANVIINNIQLMIRRASHVLYTATRQRAYFKDVRILIPQTWDDVASTTSTWETFHEAEVQVSPKSGMYGDTPYTIQAGGCGTPGDHIHLTPEYVKTVNQSENVEIYGPSDKVFVHEWGHLRYGVFDEYGVPGDSRFPLFYVDTSDQDKIIPNVCADHPTQFTTNDEKTGGFCQSDPSTGLYDENCRFYFESGFTPASSLMSYHIIDSVVHFCDDSTHNTEAPNKHNAMCNSRSVWSVITDHADFANNRNPPSSISNIDPTFKVVRPGGVRFVLVADVSGSMTSYNRMTRLHESAQRWIKYDIPDGSYVGIVQFSSASQILSPLVLINGEASRNSLMTKVPNNANGGTCIGCGLQKALQVLGGNSGGVIILLTDGEENASPTIRDVLPSIKAAEVRVVSIAFGRSAADAIEDLAQETDGKSYFVNDNDNQGLNNAFTGSLTYQPALPSSIITVQLFKKEYKNSGTGLSKTFAIDSTVGRNLIFQVDYSQRNHLKSIKLTSPNQGQYTNVVYDDTVKVARITIPLAEIGEWRFEISVSASTSDSIVVTVTSQPRTDTIIPIVTNCYVPNGPTNNNPSKDPVKIVAEVKQGANPVVGAVVKAYVEKPEGKIDVIDLYDNGAMADNFENDGIYSRYFPPVFSAGRYTVECQVWDDGSAFVNDGFIGGSNIVVNDPDTPYCCGSEVPIGETTPTGPFTRNSDGGAFKITNPVPNNDAYPPSKVFDLTVLAMDSVDMSVTIQWTAPGDELDSGTVSLYKIRYSPNVGDLSESAFDASPTPVLAADISDGSLQPLQAGIKQNVTFLLRNATQDVTYFIALKAVDKVSKQSPVSNVISVKMARIPAERRYVLVADVSSLMNNFDRINQMRESARRWIQYDVPDDSFVGIVQFSSSATAVSQLVYINSSADRSHLTDLIPNSAEDVSVSCVGCGLKKGLEVLQPSGKGGVILLMTDGEENKNPAINTVLPAIVQAGVRVVSVNFGRRTKDVVKLSNAATETYGKSFFVDDTNTNRPGLYQASIGALTYQTNVDLEQITIQLFKRQYNHVNRNQTEIADRFAVDSNLGRNLRLVVISNQLESLTLTSPNGTQYHHQQLDTKDEKAVVSIEQAQPGIWSFRVNSRGSVTDSIKVVVTTQTRQKARLPVSTDCFVLEGSSGQDVVRIFAKVTAGSDYPVIHAQVNAYIELPNGQVDGIDLYDNGLLADVYLDDGTYSRFYTVAEQSSQAKMIVKCQVWDDNSTNINNGFVIL